MPHSPHHLSPHFATAASRKRLSSSSSTSSAKQSQSPLLQIKNLVHTAGAAASHAETEFENRVKQMLQQTGLSPRASRRMLSKSATELTSLSDEAYDQGFHSDEDNESLIPRCRSLDTHSTEVFDRGKQITSLRRSNSVDNNSRSSTLKCSLAEIDSDFDVDQEYDAWSTRHQRLKDESEYDEQEMKRQDVIAEFIHTERTYLRDLLLLQKAYQDPIKASNLLAPGVSERIFINLNQIVELHRNFKRALIKLPGTNDFVESIAACVLEFFTMPEFTDYSLKYCTNLSDSLMVLKERMRTPEFAAFVIECESNPLCRRKHLKELLPAPMQRVTKYPLLVQQLLKRTNSELEEHAQLGECLNSIKSTCGKIDSEVARMESMRTEKAARARLQAIDVNLDIGEVILNLPVRYEDKNIDVNIVLFEKFIVLFPNDKSLYCSSSSSSSTNIEDNTQIMAVSENIMISQDKSTENSMYLVAVRENIICHIRCRTTAEYETLLAALERAKNKESHKPAMKLLDLASAEVNERNRPPSIPTSSTDEEPASYTPEPAIERTGQRGPALSTQRSTDSTSSTYQEVQERLDKADQEIFNILSYKLKVMQEYYGSRRLPAGARDIPQSITQLSSDANTLHDVALNLLQHYPAPDKDDKLLKIRSSFSSMASNIEYIAQNVFCSTCSSHVVSEEDMRRYNQQLPEENMTKLRRASIMIAGMLPWRMQREEGVTTPDGAPRRTNRKYNKQRSNTHSPLKLSPKSSTESLNKVSCNRLSSGSHYSTDSDAECQVPAATARNVCKTNSARAAPSSKGSTFDHFFRRSQLVQTQEERPVITGPVLQHTTNKLLTGPVKDDLR